MQCYNDIVKCLKTVNKMLKIHLSFVFICTSSNQCNGFDLSSFKVIFLKIYAQRMTSLQVNKFMDIKKQ